MHGARASVLLMASGGVIRELLASFGFEVDASGLEEGENRLEEFGHKLKNIAAGIAGAFAVHELFEFAEGQTKAMHAVERTSAMLGISTDKVQEFQFAAKALGEDSETLLNMMGRLQVAQQGAAGGSKQGAAAFAALGVHVKDSSGHMKTADELLLDVADGISNLKDPSKAAAVATQLFGRQGRQLLPFLKEGRKGAEELAEEYKKLGGGYTDKAIESGKKLEHAMARQSLATESLKGSIMEALGPALKWLTDKGTDAVVWLRQMTEGSNIVEAAMLTLGVAAAGFALKMAIANAPIIAWSVGLAFLVLLADSFITMMKGGKSVIGDAIDAMFGKGSSLKTVEHLKALWTSIKEAIVEAAAAYKSFFDISDSDKKPWYSQTDWGIGDALARGKNWVKEGIAGSQAQFDREHGAKSGPMSYMGQFTPESAMPPAAIFSGGSSQPSMSYAGDINVTVHANTNASAPEIASVVKETLQSERRDAVASMQQGASR